MNSRLLTTLRMFIAMAVCLYLLFDRTAFDPPFQAIIILIFVIIFFDALFRIVGFGPNTRGVPYNGLSLTALRMFAAMAVCLYLVIFDRSAFDYPLRAFVILLFASIFWDAYFRIMGYGGEPYNGLSTIRMWWEDGDEEVEHSPEVVDAPFIEGLPHGDGISGDE